MKPNDMKNIISIADIFMESIYAKRFTVNTNSLAKPLNEQKADKRKLQ